MTDFQPRYVAYARSHGRTVEEQAAMDRESNHLGYLAWVNARWVEWEKGTGNGRIGRDHTDADHAAFDAWLTARTDRLDTEAERLANDPAFIAEAIALERRLAEVTP